MGGVSTCSRIFLAITNTVFLIIGILLFGLGLFVRFGSAVIDPYVDDVKTQLSESAKSVHGSSPDFSTFSLTDSLYQVSLALIFLGLGLLIITFLGCCGSCYKIKCMLIIYIVLCVLLLLCQITVVILLYAFTDTIQSSIKQNLKDGIQGSYMGLNGTNTVSLGWNIAMQQLKCCGIDNYNDFTGAAVWPTVYTGYTLITPLACCKTLPSSSNYACASTTGATDTNNYKSTGCYETLWDKTFGNTIIAACVLGGIGVLQLALIIFGIILLCAMKKNKIRHKGHY